MVVAGRQEGQARHFADERLIWARRSGGAARRRAHAKRPRRPERALRCAGARSA
jgi:hypothetical protein